jgi:hypothetical protein
LAKTYQFTLKTPLKCNHDEESSQPQTYLVPCPQGTLLSNEKPQNFDNLLKSLQHTIHLIFSSSTSIDPPSMQHFPTMTLIHTTMETFTIFDKQ